MVENQWLEREDKQLKRQFDQLIMKTIDSLILDNTFDFQNESWDVTFQRDKIIEETVDALAMNFFAIQAVWDGESDKHKLSKYIDKMFCVNIMNQQLSHYTNISLDENTAKYAAIRNILSFYRESGDSQTPPSNFFINNIKLRDNLKAPA